MGNAVTYFHHCSTSREAIIASHERRRSEDEGAPQTQAEFAADLWYARGYDAELSDPHAAEAAYACALAHDPYHSAAHANYGRLRHALGDFAAAEEHYRRALELDPEEPLFWYNLGVVLQDRDQREQAIVAYRRCLRVAPGFGDAHFNLAGLLERQGDHTGALRHLATYRRLQAS
ncbi:tetratricopeptide repeat protein [Haliangium ochraceum]|uniref:Tetratricopeptide TPR_2 repeat protein n=1 Tax=Haliangium ochraceum (strain DSM 14365 / JCM 11303 / SMP-2) TaxID=502025 RepID=D0LTQ5_HALO1|nr:tetratricopeptide repeat protein [Haliangium ochraceum]ACY15749.1 Tetratricopeptide TPR_2 repeat protein [Haliangium ochraceum DSM 14365]